MKRIKTPLAILIWVFLGLYTPWMVIGPLGPALERLWAWAVTHFPNTFQNLGQMGWMHILIFSVMVIPAGWVLKKGYPQLNGGMAWLLTALTYGLVYKVACFLPDISSYPFSLSWSEASRYYYASLYLSQKVYGMHAPLSVLHPSRYLMQAVPFLISEAPLWMHRAWQVFLWLATSGMTGWLITRRVVKNKPRPVRLALGMAAVLFLFQGPVYYHLLVMVIAMLWAFNRLHPWRTLVVVLIASLWAGISRVNWLPVPGMLAAAMYFLETPVSISSDIDQMSTHGRLRARLRSYAGYLLHPAAWTILGSLVAWGSQLFYQAISGNPSTYFGSSFTSDLLWYRLLPNPTYPLGILPSALLVSLPILGLMAIRLIPAWRGYHPLRLLGPGAILAVLFAGGVVVSVKIGGGSNLHNLDAYLVLLLVIGSYITFGIEADTSINCQRKKKKEESRWYKKLQPWVIGVASAVPLFFTLSAGGVWPQHDTKAAQADLVTLRQAAQQAVMNGGKVLLINQRHLLTFGELPGVFLEADYELVFLMEMAMAGNQEYLDTFHTDLQNHRFDLIISEPLNVQYQGKAHSFGEENDAWVTQVSKPVLCHYQPLSTLKTAGVVLYVPSPEICH